MTWRIPASITLLLSLLFSASVAADDFDFEIPEEEDVAPRLEFSGNLDTKWGFLRTRERSPFYRLSFPGESADNLLQSRLELYLDGEYRTGEAGFFLKTFTQAIPGAEAEHALFELFGTLNLSPRLQIGVGKYRYNWGKGYAFNPVGYVNTQKDPENPDLALAGKPSAFVSTNRTLDTDWLKNFSVTGVLLQPDAELNGRFAPADELGLALKLYLLLWDIDLDFMTSYQKDQPQRFGIDFAANVRSNLEVHGEFSVARDEPRLSVDPDGMTLVEDDSMAYLLGARYLSRHNTTFIVDYYHQDAGLSQDDFGQVLEHMQEALAADQPQEAAATRAMLNTAFPARTFLRDYLYVKVSQPEPFGWLYSSVSAFSIVSLSGTSLTFSPQLSYKRFTNTEILLWPTLFLGSHESEYGSKQTRWKLEVWMRVHF